MTTDSGLVLVLRDRPPQHTSVVAETLPAPGQGQVVLAVDRFGLSANDVSYALVGDMLGHRAGSDRVPAGPRARPDGCLRRRDLRGSGARDVVISR